MAALTSSSKLLLLVASLFSFFISTSWAYPRTARNESVPHQDFGRVFDYVIVGAGPGGLVMANRLTENSNVSVAVIEAGTWAEDVVGNWSDVPAYNGNFDLVSANATPSGADWGFLTTPQSVRLDDPLIFPFRRPAGVN